MFAPYCPTCTSRQLLGFGRLVAGNWEAGGTLYVRCHCGTVVAADNPPAGRHPRSRHRDRRAPSPLRLTRGSSP